MSDIKEKSATPRISPQDEFFRNFEWGPYQEGAEDQRDIPLVKNGKRRTLAPIISPVDDFFSTFEWGPYQVGCEDQRD